MENYLTVPTNDGDMCTFVVAPPSPETKCPVVIVFQEAFGVNGHIRSICQRLAQEGFLAIAPELYHRQGKHLQFDYSDKSGFLSQMEKLSNTFLLEDTRATLEFLKSIPSADLQNVFTLGFCMGGFTSLLSATEFPLRGAVSFYGAGVVRERPGIGLKPFVSALSQSKAPLLMFFGEEDVSISESDRSAIHSVLSETHISHEMVVFGQADHGFFCDERKTFHHASATRAWEKTIFWLNHLKI